MAFKNGSGWIVPSKPKQSAKRVILWFRKDLRLNDNILLSNKHVHNCENLTPIYIFDPREFGDSKWIPGFQKQSNRRVKFLLESVQCLKNNLRARNSDLLLFHGNPEEIIPALCASEPSIVITGSEVAHYEKETDRILKKALPKVGSELVTAWGRTLLHPDDIHLQAMRLSGFTTFRKVVEKNWHVRALHKTPASLPQPKAIEHDALLSAVPELKDFGLERPIDDDRSDLHWVGGENEALNRLEKFVKSGLSTYKSTRNELAGADYSSKMSAWLALGCISPKQIYWRISQYEKQNGESVHTYWISFEMLWRDYFTFLCLEHGAKFFYEYGPKNDRKMKWSNDREKFKKWRDGQTGVPLIDACMRQLKLTGYMSNRGRQNVASYLILDLQLDWRLGASHFEEYLLDHDVAVNCGNWIAAANLLGGRMNKFNPVKQGKDYDCEGNFVKLFCPELNDVPSNFIHSPGTMNSGAQRKANCILGRDYPNAMTKTGWVQKRKHTTRANRNNKWKRSRPHQGRTQIFTTT